MVCLPCACLGRTAVRFPANSSHMRCVELTLEGLTSAGKCLLYTGFPNTGSAVCSSLHCGTHYLIAVLARPTAQVPRWAGSVSGGAGSIPERFWRTGVPSFRRCSAEPWHSGSVKYRDVVRPLHRHIALPGPWLGVPEKQILKKHGFSPVSDGRLCHSDEPQKGENSCPWLPLSA